MVYVYKTKISKGAQTVVPAAIRKLYHLIEGDTVRWVMDNKNVMVEFSGKKMKLKDLVGKIEMGKTNHRMIDEVVNK